MSAQNHPDDGRAMPPIVERLRNPPFADRIHMLALHTEAADTITELLSIAWRWAALDGGAGNVARYESERAELLADTTAAISKALGHGDGS
jgi:hypothetical protein